MEWGVIKMNDDTLNNIYKKIRMLDLNELDEEIKRLNNNVQRHRYPFFRIRAVQGDIKILEHIKSIALFLNRR